MHLDYRTCCGMQLHVCQIALEDAAVTQFDEAKLCYGDVEGC